MLRRARRHQLRRLGGACAALPFAVVVWTISSSCSFRPAPIEDPIAVLPADTVALVEVDLDALRRSRLLDRVLGVADPRTTAAELTRRCGFDPIAGLRSLAVALDANSVRTGDFVVLARGRVDRDKTIACARRVVEDRGRSLTESTVGRYSLYVQPGRGADSGREWAISAADARTVVAGSAALARRVLAIASEQRGGLQAGAPLLALRDRVGPLRALRLAANLGEDWSASLRLRPAWESLRRLRMIGATLGVDPGLEVAAVGSTPSAADAEALATATRAGLQELRARAPMGLAGLLGFIDTLAIETRGADVTASLRLDDRRTRDLFDQIELLIGSRP